MKRYIGRECCKCGSAERYVSSRKCVACTLRRTGGRIRARRAAGLDWGRSLLSGARARAKLKRLPIDLTSVWVEQKLQGGVCELSGLAFDLATGRGRWQKFPFVPSIDRIRPELGYLQSNCRIVCLIVNEAMNRWGEEPLMRLARRLVARELL